MGSNAAEGEIETANTANTANTPPCTSDHIRPLHTDLGTGSTCNNTINFDIQQMGSLFVVQNGDNNNLVINLKLKPSPGVSTFSIIRTKLLNNAQDHGFRKRAGIVYRPIEGCPCAFVQHCDYKRFITDVLASDPLYAGKGKILDEALKYLTNYTGEKRMPELESDRDLISFSNGVLHLSNTTFIPYTDVEEDCELATKVARHHVPHVYTSSPLTPLLDVILDAQMNKDVSEVLCALIGRSFFKINQLDGWQVMMFMVGTAGTGKNTILDVISNLFAPGAVGRLAPKREDVFALSALFDKEVVLGRNMPAKTSALLPQGNMQSMTSGEGMEIPRKGHAALQVTWPAALILAGNNFHDYIDTGNNVGRRMVNVRFDKAVGKENVQSDLLQRILNEELPNILCRCLTAYFALRKRASEMGGFWKAVPKVMLEWKVKPQTI